MTTATGRTVNAADFLPGMPDRTKRTPPKAEEYEALTLDQAIERAHNLLDQALDRWPAHAVLTLFSGGGDSSVLAHLLRERVTALAHIRTGIAIPATWTYVQAVAAEWNLTLVTGEPADRYEDLVMGRVKARTGPNIGRSVWIGFPGPAGHSVMYTRLKERALDRIRNEIIQATGRGRGRQGDILFLAGMRWGESERRFRNAQEFDPWGSVVWVSPIVWWTNAHMREYRARYMCQRNHEHAPHRLCSPAALPLSEVTEKLHMSGDCLCGAYAKPGELDEIEFWYPEVAAQIRALEAEAKAARLGRCIWGEGKRKGEPEETDSPGRLCSKCLPPLDGQLDITDDWLARGLLSPAQHQALTAAQGPP